MMSCEKNHSIVFSEISKTDYMVTTTYVCERCGMKFINIKRKPRDGGE